MEISFFHSLEGSRIAALVSFLEWFVGSEF